MDNYTASNDLVHATTQIVAAYVGNPSHKVPVGEIANLFNNVHSLVSGAAGTGGAAQPSIAAPAQTAALPAPAAAPSSEVIQSLAGSVVHAGSPQGQNIDTAKVWPNATPEQREKFLALMIKENIQFGADGRPVPRRPLESLVTPWEVFDPISGLGFKMMKRHLSVAYDMDVADLRAMYFLPDDFPVTAPAYSESKRKQAEQSGLGKGPKPARAKKVAAKTTAAPKTTARRGRAKTAASA